MEWVTFRYNYYLSLQFLHFFTVFILSVLCCVWATALAKGVGEILR